MEQVDEQSSSGRLVKALNSDALRDPPQRRGASYRRSSFREMLIRLKQSQSDIVRQQVEQMEALIADLDRTASALESHIQAEQERTGIHDPAHFAYSTYAKATIVRHDNLKQSINEVRRQLVASKAGLAGAPGK
jgi:hypothetical protein